MNWIHSKPINNEKINKLFEICLKTNQFTNGGENVKKLENLIRDKLEIDESKDIICVTNATVGLWCLCNSIEQTEKLENKSKIKWCTQSFTFPPSAQGLLKGTEIVDIDEEGGLDLEKVPKECNGIIVTNIFGNVVNIDKYTDWAKNNNKYLVFDNAATAYTFYKGKNSCVYGNGSVISFHHTKPFGFGEGGAIIIDKKYSEMTKRLINFGLNNDKKTKWEENSGNYKMSEISAIYIIQYLEDYFENIIKHHIKMYNKYINKYKMYPNYGDKDKTVLSCFCLLNEKYTFDFINEMTKIGIICKKYYIPLKETENAIEMYNKILCYPLNLEITEINKYI